MISSTPSKSATKRAKAARQKQAASAVASQGNKSKAGSPKADRKQRALKAGATLYGRNDLCPCGSGKKYKRCHGAAA